MPKQLDQFTEEWDDEPAAEKQVPRATKMKDTYDRVAMFRSMTQGRGKPMTFGVQRKDKK